MVAAGGGFCAIGVRASGSTTGCPDVLCVGSSSEERGGTSFPSLGDNFLTNSVLESVGWGNGGREANVAETVDEGAVVRDNGVEVVLLSCSGKVCLLVEGPSLAFGTGLGMGFATGML